MSYADTTKNVISFLLSKIPSPITYLKSVIREDTQDRVSAFLAVLAGIALVIGFLVILTFITFLKRPLGSELITISGALVVLATFSKVDRNDSTVLTVTDKPKINNDDTKKDDTN